MSPEEARELYVQTQVDEIFFDTFGSSLDGRIKMAAFAISDRVRILQDRIDERDAAHDAVPSAPKKGGVSIFASGYQGVAAPDETLDAQELDEMEDLLHKLGFGEESSAVKEARRARDAALEDAKARYDLTKRQARKALHLAETSFKVFLVTDSE